MVESAGDLGFARMLKQEGLHWQAVIVTGQA
jgi:hypothetical protein